METITAYCAWYRRWSQFRTTSRSCFASYWASFTKLPVTKALGVEERRGWGRLDQWFQQGGGYRKVWGGKGGVCDSMTNNISRWKTPKSWFNSCSAFRFDLFPNQMQMNILKSRKIKNFFYVYLFAPQDSRMISSVGKTMEADCWSLKCFFSIKICMA